jgi:DNA topoisomerase-1
MIHRVGDYKSGFKYFKNKTEITDKVELEKIKTLKIPPAYQNVVIVNTKKIIAYGFDSKGRKQVLYSSDFTKKQSEKKFKKIFTSLHAFERIKSKIARDMKSTESKKKEIAIIIYMIFNCGFRIGNKKYEKCNNSIGLTTLKFSHMTFRNKDIIIDFIGKKGVRNTSICKNKYIYEYLLKKSQSSTLNDYVFSYTESEIIRNITSVDVNDYLKNLDPEINLTSKDLRTWNANYLFVKFFKEAFSEKIKNPVKQAIDMVSKKLHNTPNICKKSYIDPKIIENAENILRKHSIQK